MHELFKSNSFVWWQGVVEDRKDPQRLGRCRGRVFGYHDKDKNLIAIAKFANPVKKTEARDLLFKLRLDF